MTRDELIPDHLYGGVFVTEEDAFCSFDHGCPPSEIFIAYIGCREHSIISRVPMKPIQGQIAQHIEKCMKCRRLLIMIIEGEVKNKLLI